MEKCPNIDNTAYLASDSGQNDDSAEIKIVVFLAI